MPHGPLCAALTLGLLLTSITGIVGTHLGNRAIDSEEKAARAFVAALEPRLRAYFDEHGRFPTTLDSFGVKVPTVGFSEITYLGSQSSFQFTYQAPYRLFDRWEYNSDGTAWIEN